MKLDPTIIKLTSEAFGISELEISGRGKRREITTVRAGMFGVLYDAGISYSQISKMTGYHHTSVITSVVRSYELQNRDEGFKAKVDDLKKKMQAIGYNVNFSLINRGVASFRLRSSGKKNGIVCGRLTDLVDNLETMKRGLGHWLLDQVPDGSSLVEVLQSMVIDAHNDEVGE